MVTTEPLSPDTVRAVAHAMRESDRREIFALRADDDADRVADEACLLSRFGAVALWNERPVAALGAAEVTPGIFEVWLFATDFWPRVAPSVLRWAVARLKPAMLAAGGHRAQCLSIAGRRDAQRMLERFGFVREAVLHQRGRGRETFHLYAWRLDDVCDPVQSAKDVPHRAATA